MAEAAGPPGDDEAKREARRVEARARALKAAENRRLAVELRLAGATYDAIGQRLGISKQAVHKAVRRVLDETAQHVRDEGDRLRALEVRRLDALLLSLWQSRASPRVADTIIRLFDRRAKLLGLDAREESGFDPLTGKPVDAGGAPPAGPVTFRLEVVAGREMAPRGGQRTDEDPEPADDGEPGDEP